MPTVIIDVPVAVSGKLLWARVYNPDATIAGGFAVPENTNAGAVPLGTFSASGVIAFSGVDGWAKAEVREVSVATSAGFDASSVVRAGPGVIGYVKGGVLLSDPNLDAAVSSVAIVNTGPVSVSWNYNGNDFRVLRGLGASQPGISGARIYAYVAAEFVSNPNTAQVKGYAITDDTGKWVGMGLSSGVTYLLRAVLNDGSPVMTATFTV